MDTNFMIKEIKEFVYTNTSENKTHSTQTSIWLENIDDYLETCYSVSTDLNTQVDFYPFKDDIIKICNEEELNHLFGRLGVNLELMPLFNIEIIETKKWGKKPLFRQGIKSICFEVVIKEISNYQYVMFFNKSGSKSIESVYVNGIWAIEKAEINEL
ncbi:MAG: hypothetical protein A3D31_03330 [Candidatus Fluviicola riflensis]|nr:MAG: hypothetical protein CHH17_11700 [Candidatus Fluviicola riflensis]OGS79015.1 MAG: hypothetical protein A3D31_03330 [Candidatus Fluviicola riflensis]OGS86038.1 MAG: hypothetical protein A3E30_10820 [Fluviicola sp. RIFCSPHIGHO2_12_FULL_43_24]OGS86447.1 MAG: hypothetical protein A2724_02790 [Fluviicola sp. RIFCSPHIGHO2_01_FULL_43_53]